MSSLWGRFLEKIAGFTPPKPQIRGITRKMSGFLCNLTNREGLTRGGGCAIIRYRL